ncbi:unnamed protein product [Linum tenue]|uniref:HMA domain-containing protein n=1 Tax=Linum tenue TaxID=586396 RepID=A0AAV0NKN5_9ROSI|nr:unnamed protein product [Linum tenue]
MALVVRQHKEENSVKSRKKKKNKRSMSVPGISSLASIESLSMPLVQEVVISANMQCAQCQKRVADVISRMSGTESVTVNLVEKQVTLTCTYPGPGPGGGGRIFCRNPLSRIAIISRRIFGSYSS